MCHSSNGFQHKPTPYGVMVDSSHPSLTKLIWSLMLIWWSIRLIWKSPSYKASPTFSPSTYLSGINHQPQGGGFSLAPTYLQTWGGYYQNFIQPHKKIYRVLVIQEKKLYEIQNYHSLDEMTHTILYLKQASQTYPVHVRCWATTSGSKRHMQFSRFFMFLLYNFVFNHPNVNASSRLEHMLDDYAT